MSKLEELSRPIFQPI